MTYMLAVRFLAEPVRSISFLALGPAYMGIGTPIDHPARQFLIWNRTDVDLMFSFNGVDDHFLIPANTGLIDDVCSNTSISQGWFLAKETRLYVKELATPAGAGAVYFSVFYGKEV
jgi:hypothetical protein